MSRDFNGTTSLINASSSALLNNAQPFTIAAWIAADNLGEAANGYIVAKDTNNSAGAWQFTVSGGSILVFRKNLAGTNIRLQSVGISSLTNGAFQHVALTWAGTNNASSVLFYYNGNTLAYGTTQNGTGSLTSDATQPFIIGNAGDTSRTFDGRIAHVHFFRRVLTIDEIRQVRLHPASTKAFGVGAAGSSHLIGYWSLGGFSGNEPDWSGNGHTGIVTTAPIVTGPGSDPTVNETFLIGNPMGLCV